MSLTELFIIAVGLSMDAFAVSVCKGLSVQMLKLGHALTCGVYFGGFQGLMPALGYLLGSQFQSVIVKDRLYPAGDHRDQYDPGIPGYGCRVPGLLLWV